MALPVNRPQIHRIYLLVMVGLAFILALYAVARFGSWWSEPDTTTITSHLLFNFRDARLVPEGIVYPLGYGYQALAMFVIQTTGISLGSFQSILALLLMAWLVVPAWLAFRELVHSELAASLAVLILLAQPEFLFPLLRGTHEKFTRGLMFICIYLLLRSLRARSLRQIIAFIACFYLSTYALIAFNIFMATSFILAVVLALMLMWLIGLWLPANRERGQQLTRKLLYVSLSSLVIAFLFMFYAYPPAAKQILVLRDVWDRMAFMFLQIEETTSSPYQVISTGWISRSVYLLVTLANWLLLGLTLPIWLRQAYTWFIKRKVAPAQHELALWAFYAAFGFLGFVSIFVDLSGAIASNLQHRIFPTFAMVAAPLAGLWLASANRGASFRGRIFKIGASISLASLMFLAVLKATNEPLLSNYWSFSTPGESASIDWAQQALYGHNLWTGLDGRVSNEYFMDHTSQPQILQLDPFKPESSTHDYLVSDITRLYALRTSQQLPILYDSLITYDNGAAQIYHRRPVTPFQK